MARRTRKQRRTRYAASWNLFHALVSAETGAAMFALDLQRLQRELKDAPPPEDLSYIAPPDSGDDEEMRRLREDRRAEALQPVKFHLKPEDREKLRQATQGSFDSEDLNPRPRHEHWFDRFDAYHRSLRSFRHDLDVAKLAAVRAAHELDRARSAPLDRHTSKIRYDLQNLGGAVPFPLAHGDYPPSDPKLPPLIRSLTLPISEWINRLRAFLLPQPPSKRKPTHRRRRVAESREGATSESPLVGAGQPKPAGVEQGLSEERSPAPLTLHIERPRGGRSILILERYKGEEIHSAEIAGPSQMLLFNIVEQVSAAVTGPELISWKDIHRKWNEVKAWKGRLSSINTLQDYGRRIKKRLQEGGLDRYWKQTTDGVRWQPPAATP